jgi:CDP-6-deoxy-D-xylo-4-hexulose-3-dehydrase
MGEGGAVVTNNPLIHKSIRQFRDWGRDCWCDTGKDNTCARRFDWQLGKLPHGYDHKYIYSQIGYNLKLTDMQAAIGLAQLAKLPTFIEQRRFNFTQLMTILEPYSDYLQFSDVEPKAEPSWFGFMILIKPNAPFTKRELVTFLETKKIGTRSLFAGNLLRHPAYLKRNDFRVIGSLPHTEALMEKGFWIGVYPGITKTMIDYIDQTFSEFFSQFNPGIKKQSNNKKR